MVRISNSAYWARDLLSMSNFCRCRGWRRRDCCRVQGCTAVEAVPHMGWIVSSATSALHVTRGPRSALRVKPQVRGIASFVCVDEGAGFRLPGCKGSLRNLSPSRVLNFAIDPHRRGTLVKQHMTESRVVHHCDKPHLTGRDPYD